MPDDIRIPEDTDENITKLKRQERQDHIPESDYSLRVRSLFNAQVKLSENHNTVMSVAMGSSGKYPFPLQGRSLGVSKS